MQKRIIINNVIKTANLYSADEIVLDKFRVTSLLLSTVSPNKLEKQ